MPFKLMFLILEVCQERYCPWIVPPCQEGSSPSWVSQCYRPQDTTAGHIPSMVTNTPMEYLKLGTQMFTSFEGCKPREIATLFSPKLNFLSRLSLG